MRAETLYDPVRLAEETERVIVRDIRKKYYRKARSGKWYGGIASAFCCGCCLRCVFCWSGLPRDSPESIGDFYSPEDIFSGLIVCARKNGYSLLRVTGNEPTIGREHLFRILELVDQTPYTFILETNGILIGYDINYAQQLSRFKHIHVRVSLKGTNSQEFSLLTGAVPEAFELQLRALKNLYDAGVSYNPAAMLSFSTEKDLENLEDKLQQIDSGLIKNLEKEYVILYPPVIKRLKEVGIKPKVICNPYKIFGR